MKIDSIIIRVSGLKAGLVPSLENDDIRKVIASFEGLFYSFMNNDRRKIYCIAKGDFVRYIFETSRQFVIGFNAVLDKINRSQSIDFLDVRTASAIENIQNITAKKNYSFSIKASLDLISVIKVNKATRFYKTEGIWADAEFFFYGKVTDSGGKGKANIHTYTEEFGAIAIQISSFFRIL